MGVRWSTSAAKVKLRMAVERSKMLINSKNAAIRRTDKEIAELLVKQKDESARIKAEGILREHDLILCLDALILMMDLLLARLPLINAEKVCPPDLEECVASLIYSSSRVEVAELQGIAELFASKYSRDWVLTHTNNTSGRVSSKVLGWLRVTPPSFQSVLEYLTSVAEKYELDWKPNLDATDSNKLGAIAPIHDEEDIDVDDFKIPSGPFNSTLPGTFHVILHEAKDLYQSAMMGLQNPVIKFSLQHTNVVLTSRVLSGGGQAPKWGQDHFPFPVERTGLSLHIEIFHINNLGDPLIGEARVSIDDNLKPRKGPQWLPLYRDGSKRNPAGSLSVTLFYTAISAPGGSGGGGGASIIDEGEFPPVPSHPISVHPPAPALVVSVAAQQAPVMVPAPVVEQRVVQQAPVAESKAVPPPGLMRPEPVPSHAPPAYEEEPGATAGHEDEEMVRMEQRLHQLGGAPKPADEDQDLEARLRALRGL